MSDIKKKSIYTVYSRTLSMIISIVSQFVLTPIILGILGTTLYGVYTLVNKANNFLSIVDLRPTAILRLRLAHGQISEGINEKRKYIGASYVVSIIFTPVFVIGGCVLAYYFPDLFHVEREYINISRAVVILLSIFLAINGFLGIPEAILRGNNLEYKGFFVEPVRLLLVAGFSILFLYLGWGLLSVVLAMFLGSLFAYLSRVLLLKKHLSEFTAEKPQKKHVKDFFSKGGWYLTSSFLMQTIDNFDVILIGILINPKAVTLFAITKAIVFRVVESVVTLVTSTTSSVGEIMGSNDTKRLYAVRVNLFKLVIPSSLFISSYFFVFNESFIHFWTGSSVYAGTIVNSIICISAIFLMMTSTEEIFILSSLNFKTKSLCLFISAVFAIFISVCLNKPLGLAGNAIGILSGRMILFCLYNRLNNKATGKRLPLDLLFLLKTLGFVFIVIGVKHLFSDFIVFSIINFITATLLFLTIMGTYTYFILLDKELRKQVVKMIIRKK